MISTQFHNKTRYKLILITQLYRRKIKDFLSKSESYHYVKETICALHLQECLWHPRKKTTTLLHQTLEQARFGQAGGVHVALAKARLMMYCLRAASQPQKQFLCGCRNPAVTQSAEHYVPQHSAILCCNVTWLAVIPKCFCFAVIPLTVDLLQQLNQSCNTGISLSQCHLQIHKCL